MDLDSLTARAVEAGDFESVIDLMEGVMTEHGFDFLSYYLVRTDFRETSMRQGGRVPTPLRSVQEFMDLDRRIDSDPVIRRFLFRLEPFRWLEPQQDPALGPRSHEVYRLLREEGYPDGLSIPVSSGPGDLAVISVAQRGRLMDLSRAENETLYVACDLLHRRCNRILGKERRHAVSLSGRERETMRFLLDGLSNKEIAEELRVSAHTVDMYLRRIFQKLNVRNRVQAAVKYTLLSTWEAV